jgi:hypothetical protein
MKDLDLRKSQLPGGIKFNSTSLTLPPGTSPENWARTANKISNIGHGYWWWVGDLAAFAMHNFEDPNKQLEQLSAASGMGFKYIKLVSWASRKYAVRDRVAGLPISHHLKIMGLPRAKRQRLLHQARANNWPARIMQEHSQPRAKHNVVFVTRVNKKHALKFEYRLRELCKDFDATMHIWGKARPGAVVLRPGKTKTVAAERS